MLCACKYSWVIVNFMVFEFFSFISYKLIRIQISLDQSWCWINKVIIIDPDWHCSCSVLVIKIVRSILLSVRSFVCISSKIRIDFNQQYICYFSSQNRPKVTNKMMFCNKPSISIPALLTRDLDPDADQLVSFTDKWMESQTYLTKRMTTGTTTVV